MFAGSAVLRELEQHPACVPSLLTYLPATAEALETMTRDERERRSEAQTRAVQNAVNWQGARDLIRELGKARYAPAVDFLARVWRHAQIVPLRTAAGHALFDIGTAKAHAALQGALEDAEKHGHLPTFLAIKSILATEPRTAFDRLAPFIERHDRAVAHEALRILGPSVVGPMKTWWLPVVPELLRNDRRWAQAAVRLRRDGILGGVARQLLGSFSPEELDAALRETPDPPPRTSAPYEGPRDLAARYVRGEYEAVWNWARAPGVLALPEMRAEVIAVADLTMQRIRRNVERITDRLTRAGYPFDGFLPPWAPPKESVNSDAARIEQAIGGPMPLTLLAFWKGVGEVYWKFTESDAVSGTWRGLPLRESDPLCLLSPRDAWFAIEEWQQELAEKHAEVVGSLYLQLAPDHLHKANISGGTPYGFTIPRNEVDAEFENEAHALPLVDYLRLCFRWGGFPLLEAEPLSSEGTRTLAELVKDVEPF